MCWFPKCSTFETTSSLLTCPSLSFPLSFSHTLRSQTNISKSEHNVCGLNGTVCLLWQHHPITATVHPTNVEYTEQQSTITGKGLTWHIKFVTFQSVYPVGSQADKSTRKIQSVWLEKDYYGIFFFSSLCTCKHLKHHMWRIDPVLLFCLLFWHSQVYCPFHRMIATWPW